MKEYLAKDWEFKVPSTSIKSLQHKNSDSRKLGTLRHLTKASSNRFPSYQLNKQKKQKQMYALVHVESDDKVRSIVIATYED